MTSTRTPDRRAIQDELDQLNKEVDRIAYTTHFNQQYMLAEGTPQAAPGYYRIQSGALNGQAIDIHFVNASKESLGTDKVNVSSHAKASESITMVQDAIEQAALWRDGVRQPAGASGTCRAQYGQHITKYAECGVRDQGHQHEYGDGIIFDQPDSGACIPEYSGTV